MKTYAVFLGKVRVMKVYANSIEEAQEKAEYQMKKSNRNPGNDKITVKEMS